MSTVTRLRVGDEDFLVAATIERCPRTMMIRELLQNALEASAGVAAGARRVEFSVLPLEGARKLTLWNGGRGLDAEQLYRMCDIAASINKQTGLDANFGMGAKVASLPSNQHGMRYRSCRDGVVHEVMLGKRGGTYGRVLQPGPDGTPTEILEVTEAARAEGRDTGADWTEVVLLGQDPAQDTAGDPYAGRPRSAPSWLLDTIGGRYFRFPEGAEVVLRPGVPPLPPTGAEHRFRPLEERLRALPSFEGGRYEAVSTPEGLVIHYGYDPADPDRAGRNRSQVTGPENAEGLAAVVFRDEMYGPSRGAQWRREAPSFGIPVSARHISVLVELPAGYPAQAEGYREFLRYREGAQAQLRLIDFAPQVAQHQPDWLREILAGGSPGAALAAEVQSEMEELIQTLGVVRRRPPRPRTADAPPPVPANTAAAPAEPAPPGAPKPPAPARPIVLENAPALFLLRDEAAVADAGLAHRAACYYPESHQLHVNMRYGAIPLLASLLLEGTEPDPALDAAATEAAERATVLRVARALVHGLNKRGRPAEWNDHHLRQALSPEALTLAADDIHGGLADARAAFRQAQVAVAEPEAA
ncbi:ATP-binding protein [Roseomonas elaeocarpi]|uniref:ATP-binding protein n=1 Tax=Roseomonas elaeocarpi TaxID=907779 RepID=A0ABV6JUP2_9PROT